MPLSSDSPKKTTKKTTVTMAATPAPVAPTVIAVPTSQVVLTTGFQSTSPMPPAIKKQKTAGEWNDTGLYLKGRDCVMSMACIRNLVD